MICCVSDWHIDNGHNEFSWHYKQAHDFLDFVGKEPLFMIGDTLELWACEWYEVWGGPYEPLLKRIRERPYDTTIFQGNHDIQALVLQRFFPEAEVVTSRIVGDRQVFHGFQVDPILDTPEERWLIAGIDRACTLIDIPWLNALRDRIADADRSNKPLIQRLKNAKKRVRYLMGHSHIEENLGWFVNCGSLLRSDFPYVELEENGDAALKFF